MITDVPQPAMSMTSDDRDRRDRDRDLDDTATFRRRWEDRPTTPPPPERQWLDPRLLIQVVTIIITMTAGWVTLGNRLDVLQEKLSSIQGQLPNREVLDLKLKGLEEEQERIARIVETQDAWIRNTRERLAEKGWKP